MSTEMLNRSNIHHGCRWCKAHGVRCSSKGLPGAQPRQLYRLTCSDEDYLMDARRQLDRLLRCTQFKHEHIQHLFSHYGRERMQHIDMQASKPTQAAEMHPVAASAHSALVKQPWDAAD